MNKESSWACPEEGQIPMRRDLLFLKDIINAMNKIFSYTEKMTKEDLKKIS